MKDASEEKTQFEKQYDQQDYEYAEPEAKALSQSLRAFGYDVSTAIADLIDNSIAAQAKNIYVQFEWNDKKPWVAIIDDGLGMTEENLHQAMKPGSTNPLDQRDKKDLGRFGLGLKTASFSQCRSLTVITKPKSGDIYVRRWDLDIIAEKNQWLLLKNGTSESEELRKRIDEYEHGTVVLWEKLDRIVPEEFADDEAYQKAFLEYGHQVKEHISEVFSSYMYGQNKINFFLNDMKIEMWDPFALNNSHTTILPKEKLYVNNKPVEIKAYVLPHQKWLDTESFIKLSGRNGWTQQQGFYVYRNNRLIISADWLLPGMQKKEQYKLARIRIDIGNEIDAEWGIDVKKSVAVPPVSIQKEIYRIATAARKKSAQIYRHKGQIISRKSTEQSFVWHQINRGGKLGYQINRKHPLIQAMLSESNKNEIKQLLELIEETIPVPAIISDYSDHSDELLQPYEGKDMVDYDKAIEKLYNAYLLSGASPAKALEIIAGTEPFIYSPEKIELFCEKKGIKK